jgi:hypothetical protein
MRMSGHAHHDDMLYLGKEQPRSWDYHVLHETGYADRGLYAFWQRRDPIPAYAARLESEKLIDSGELDRMKAWAGELVERQARAVIDAPWPAAEEAGDGVFAGEARRVRIEVLDPAWRLAQSPTPALPPLEPGLPFDT